MTNVEVLTAYTSMAALTRKMVAAATVADWDGLESLEQQVTAHVATLRGNEEAVTLDASERQAVEQGLADARDALRSDDMDRIRRAYENLTRVAQTLTQAASRQARSGTGGPQGGQPSGRPSDGEVVDAEFTDTDERDQRKAS